MERGTLHAEDDVLFTVDSRYVKELIDEKFTARENRVLATLLGHMWKVTKQRLRLHIRWVRGHSGDVGNGIADRLADEGTRRELEHRWWRRCPLSGGWDQEGFIEKVVSIHSETTVCGDALETRWSGPTDFPERILHRTSKYWHWGHSQLPSPNQPGEQRSLEKPAQNSMIRCGWKCEDLKWNVAAKGSPEEKMVYCTVQSSPTDATKTDRPQLQEGAGSRCAITSTGTTAADTCSDPGEVGCGWHYRKGGRP